MDKREKIYQCDDVTTFTFVLKMYRTNLFYQFSALINTSRLAHTCFLPLHIISRAERRWTDSLLGWYSQAITLLIDYGNHAAGFEENKKTRLLILVCYALLEYSERERIPLICSRENLSIYSEVISLSEKKSLPLLALAYQYPSSFIIFFFVLFHH